MIRDITTDDAAVVCEIYNHYVEHTLITFEEDIVTPDEMARRINTITASYPWIVLVEDDSLLGYAYVTNWRTRSAYRHSCECSIYLHKDATGKGAGAKLFAALIERLKQTDFHAVMAAITLPNDASIRLHEKFGFEQVGHFKQTGRKFNQWVDVGFWELLLD